MARTRRSDYLRSNRTRTLPLPDPAAARAAARRLLAAGDAAERGLHGQRLLAILARQCAIPVPELVVPDEQQPHRRSRGRIVFSLQGEYRRRAPSAGDPRVARDGRPRGRIRILNRTPARGAVVRASAFLHTLLHEFCHHHDAESLGLLHSFHTAGFCARLRHLRDQVESDGAHGAPAGEAAGALPTSRRWWSIMRRR